MARQNINAGTGNLRGDGETLHTAFKKINENFQDLYQTSGPSYYVSQNGVDSTDRSGQSQNDSWASIEYALSQITGPATVHVMAGQYTENLPLVVPENVSVVGESQRTVTVLPANNSTGQMWQLRDGSLLAHMTFRGMTGFSVGADPTDIEDFTFNGVFVGLDPNSPIINKSPYIFDCSSISTGGIGALIDGSVHSSGNRSLLIHAYTCINEDGLGYCAINNGKAEIVSGFTYYCHTGYAAGSGGILRSLNGNATYGTYGAVSQGFDATETPLTGSLYGDQIEYINLVGTFSEGDTITGQTSLAEATVTDFQANAEKLYIKVTSGTFQEGEVVANGSGAEAEIASGGLGGQNGFLLVANGFDRRPVAGRSVQLAGDASSYVVRLISGSYVDSSSVLKLVLSDEKATKSSDGTSLELRDKFSQVRLTGHDFLNIGTGNKTQTNYPGDPIQAPSQANEIVENRPGRVYFVSTDQDGNFRVGDFFRVEQSTGIATLNANAFDLSGLSSLRLGAVGAQVGELINEFSSDGELSANSNSKVPTEAAIRTYFENVKSHIIPEENEVYDLGSPTRKWRDLYLSGNTINLGDSQIQSENSSVVLPEGSKIGTETASTFSGSFTDLTNIPTTVAGYGITDAVKPGDDISTLTNNSGFVTQTELESGNLSINIGSLEGDLVGSVFADDSTVLVDSVNAVIPGTLTGRWQNLDSAFAVTAKNSSLSVGDQVGFSLATTQGAGVSIALGGVDQFGSTPDFSLATPGAVSFSSNQLTVNASSISLSGSAVDADLKGSVFADDSTLLVDGVNGSIPYSVLSDVEVTEQDLQVDFAAIVGTQIQTNGLPVDTFTAGDLTINGSLKTNTVIAESGNLDLNADNYVRIESSNNGQIEIGRNSGVGEVIIGNTANDTDVIIEGNTTFDSGTAVDFTGTTILGTPFIETATAESQFVDIAGDTMTGSLTLPAAPTANLEAATKGYVDTVAQGLKARPADDVATDSNLDAAYSTANNTLTANTVGAINIDSASLSVGQRVLVKDQTNAYENGSFVVTDAGDASTPWVLTRDSFMNETAEVTGSFEFIQNGATYEGTGWVAIVPEDFELNNTAASSDPNYATRGDIEWVQFSGAGAFTAGTGLALSGTEFSNTGVLSVDSKTGSITAADIMTAVQKEDGAGSGLDADQLDGQEGAYYLDYNNFTNIPTGYTSTDFDTDFSSKSIGDLSDVYTANNNFITGDVSISGSGDLNLYLGVRPQHFFDPDGSRNILLGYAGGLITSGSFNIGIGIDALRQNSSGSFNIGIGDDTLFANESGNWNVAIGYLAGCRLENSFYNTIIGTGSLSDNVTGDSNTAVGYFSLGKNRGSNNTAVGKNSLFSSTGVAGDRNTAIGSEAGNAGVDVEIGGSNLTLIGYEAQPSSLNVFNEITLGNDDVTRFRIPGIDLDTGNAADGEVLQWNATNGGFVWTGLPTSTDDISEGTTNRYFSDSLARNAVSVSGDLSYNSSTGVISFTERTDAEVRGLFSAAGDLSYNQSTGEFSVSVPAGYTSADFDSDFAAKSVDGLTDGYNNGSSVGIGSNALLNDDGSSNKNTAVGQSSLTLNTSGSDNTAVGHLSLNQNFTGVANTAVGSRSLFRNKNSGNTAIGLSSLAENDSGAFNVGVGIGSLEYNINGDNNAALGSNSLRTNKGNNNTALGQDAGNEGSGNDITGSNITLIGYDSHPSSLTVSNEITLGNTAVDRFRIPGIGLDTNGAADGEVLQWNSSNGGFVWTGLPTNTSDLTNDSGFITAETDTLDSVTDRSSSTSNTITVGGLTSNGVLSIEQGTRESFSTITNATGTVTHDCSQGHIFYHTSPSANWTANFTNVSLTTNYATAFTIVINQGATAYIPTAINLKGDTPIIIWQGGTEPSGTANGTDVISFSVLETATEFVVLGQLASFGG